MNRIIKNSEPILTDDIIDDILNNYEYLELSKEEEISIIKKAKLSFYDKVDVETQKIYLNYFLESNPRLKKEFEKIVNEIQKKSSEIELKAENSYIDKIYNEIIILERKRKKLLEQAIDDSKKIRDMFIINNQRLVVRFLNRYNSLASAEELYIEGNIGLLIALEKFDIDRDTKFSTYAAFWIKHKMTRFIKDRVRIIRFPVHIEDRINEIKKEKQKIESILHREISLKELAYNTNYTIKELEFLMKIYTQCACDISLNQRLAIGSDEELIDIIEDENNPYEQTENQIDASAELAKIIKQINFSEMNLDILKMRYGIDDGIPKTLQEIADKYNLSKGRVSQIEDFCLRKIKKSLLFRYKKRRI